MAQPKTSTSMPRPPVLFFDGDCGLCHRSVAWFQRHDRRATLRYAPLQGPTYAGLAEQGPIDLSTMVMLDDRGLWTESNAVLAGLRAVGGPWGMLAAVGSAIPRFLRDAVYRFVARRRMGWFGPADACALPGDPARFLP